jgi:hypothetical protein
MPVAGTSLPGLLLGSSHDRLDRTGVLKGLVSQLLQNASAPGQGGEAMTHLHFCGRYCSIAAGAEQHDASRDHGERPSPGEAKSGGESQNDQARLRTR